MAGVAAEDQYASAEADVAAAAQSIAALVAKSWFLAIQARQQRDLAVEMVASSRELLRIAEQRQSIGPGSAVEVAQADASLQELLDTVRQLDLALAQASRVARAAARSLSGSRDQGAIRVRRVAAGAGCGRSVRAARAQA